MKEDEAPRLDNPDDADDAAPDCGPSAEGIVRCLQMLADEAATLCLPRTLEALCRAQAACAAETSDGLVTQRPAGARLH